MHPVLVIVVSITWNKHAVWLWHKFTLHHFCSQTRLCTISGSTMLSPQKKMKYTNFRYTPIIQVVQSIECLSLWLFHIWPCRGSMHSDMTFLASIYLTIQLFLSLVSWPLTVVHTSVLCEGLGIGDVCIYFSVLQKCNTPPLTVYCSVSLLSPSLFPHNQLEHHHQFETSQLMSSLTWPKVRSLPTCLGLDQKDHMGRLTTTRLSWDHPRLWAWLAQRHCMLR